MQQGRVELSPSTQKSIQPLSSGLKVIFFLLLQFSRKTNCIFALNIIIKSLFSFKVIFASQICHWIHAFLSHIWIQIVWRTFVKAVQKVSELSFDMVMLFFSSLCDPHHQLSEVQDLLWSHLKVQSGDNLMRCCWQRGAKNDYFQICIVLTGYKYLNRMWGCQNWVVKGPKLRIIRSEAAWVKSPPMKVIFHPGLQTKQPHWGYI